MIWRGPLIPAGCSMKYILIAVLGLLLGVLLTSGDLGFLPLA
jgi:hypothetical protein